MLKRENLERDGVLGPALTNSLEIPVALIAEHPKVKEAGGTASAVVEVSFGPVQDKQQRKWGSFDFLDFELVVFKWLLFGTLGDREHQGTHAEEGQEVRPAFASVKEEQSQCAHGPRRDSQEYIGPFNKRVQSGRCRPYFL